MESKVFLSNSSKDSINFIVSKAVEFINHYFVCSFKVDYVGFYDNFIDVSLGLNEVMFISRSVIDAFCEELNFCLHKIGLLSLSCRYLGVNIGLKTFSFSIDL